MQAKQALSLALVLAGAVLTGQGAWIHVKAQLAQYLLGQSWAEVVETGHRAAPWPWADTWPVARLRSDRHAVDQFVLANASGRNLAFGPTLVSPSRVPNGIGHSVISGHRDTHFGFLADLEIGDVLDLEHQEGQSRYEVVATQIVDLRTDALTYQPGEHVLTLVTCYPFDALDAGTPLRYVVHAQRMEEPEMVRISL